MLRSTRFFFSAAVVSAAASAAAAPRRRFRLETITTKEQLDAGLNVVAETFTTEEGLTVVANITFDEHIKFLKGLHKTFEDAAARGIHFSSLAVDEESGEVGAAFLVFPSTMKAYGETAPSIEPVGALVDHLHATAEAEKVLANPDPETTVWFGFAAVKEAARGQGLQKLAKKRVVEAARAHGFKSIITECTSTPSAKSMLNDSGLGTTAFARVTLPYDTYNDGFFKRAISDWGYDAAVLVEEVL